jgi:hypothetical protein
MFIKTKYINRHKILGTLYNKYSQDYSPNIIDIKEISLTFGELVTHSKLAEYQVQEQIDFLCDANEISSNEENFTDYYSIPRKGIISYKDEKYLYTGRKEFWNDTYDIVKTISTIILLIIGLATFVLNLIETKQNKNEINNIKMELHNMRDSTSKSPQ